jgi:hypothetical protein
MARAKPTFLFAATVESKTRNCRKRITNSCFLLKKDKVSGFERKKKAVLIKFPFAETSYMEKNVFTMLFMSSLLSHAALSVVPKITGSSVLQRKVTILREI